MLIGDRFWLDAMHRVGKGHWERCADFGATLARGRLSAEKLAVSPEHW